MLLQCFTQYASKFDKHSNGQRTGKGQFSFQSQREAMPKNVQTTVQLHSFHMPARLCSKSFKQGFSHTWTKTPDVQARFRKGRGTRDQIDNICWMIERARELKKQKTKNKPSTSASLTMLKPLTVWITTNCGIVLKRWEYLPPEKPVCRTRSSS